MIRALWKRIVENRASFWVAALFVGPFALPILWSDQRYSRTTKILISVGLVALTIGLLWLQYQLALRVKSNIVRGEGWDF